MELSEIPLYVYPIVFILLVILIGALSLFLGKRKYNQEHGIVKEKKVKEPRQKPAKKLKKAAPVVPADSFKDEFDTDEDYEAAAESLRAEPASKPRQKVMEGPVIVVDEKKINEEKIIEWKPPVEEKKTVIAAAAETVPAAAVLSVPDAPAESEWQDEDLELFETRAYAFDEETQSGYVTEKTAGTEEEKSPEAPPETVFSFRERKEPSRDPSEDEGVQIFETAEEPKAPEKPAEEAKISSSKYAYFDAVMEKEKTQIVPKETEWQPPAEKKTETVFEAPAKSKKSGMQYIELELDEKE